MRIYFRFKASILLDERIFNNISVQSLVRKNYKSFIKP